jgi:hypothetical protein
MIKKTETKDKNKKIVLDADEKNSIKNSIKSHGKLPERFKIDWLAALRSGKFKQNRVGDLRATDNTYCCLGVGCVVAGATGITDRQYIENTSYKKIKSINKVPKILHGDSGLPDVLGRLNDGGHTFEQIAEVIEKYL